MNGDSKALGPGLKNPADNLATLYSIVAALSLYAAVSQFVDLKNEGTPIRLASLPFLGVFLVTLVPFYHGALRHLHDAYVEDTRPNPRRGALLVDSAVLFVEGCLFIVMAGLLTNSRYFAWTFVTLLGLDAVWGTLTHLALSRHADSKPEMTWAVINFATTIITAFFLLISPSWNVQDRILGWCLFLVALSRTVLDYGKCWKTYFPSRLIETPDKRPEETEAPYQVHIASTMPEGYPLQIPAPAPGHARKERRTGNV